MSDGILGAILRLFQSDPSGGDRDLFEDLSPDLPEADAARVANGLKASLLGRGGHGATRRRVLALGNAYAALGPEGRRRFLAIVARDFAADGQATLAAVADLDEFNDWRGMFGRHRYAAEALVPPRRRLLGMFLEVTGGDKLLARMRADLPGAGTDPAALADLAEDLEALLSDPR